MHVKSKVVLLLLGCFLFIAPNHANCEWSADLYAGGAWTDDEKIDVKEPVEFTFNMDYEDSFTFGYRVGYWFESLPFLGLAVDISYFTADPDVDFDSNLWFIPISALAMARIPIATSSEYPMGRFQIYGGAGPGFFYSDIELGEFEDNAFDVGLDTRAGIAYMIHRQLALQFEFRYTYVETEYKDLFMSERIRIEAEIETIHALIGLSYRF